jgi:hypothetical protein
MAIVDLRHAKIVFQDGSLVPNEVYVKVGEGTLSYTEHRPIKYTTDRGFLDEVIQDTPQPIDAKIDCTWLQVGAPYTKHDPDGSTSTSVLSRDVIDDILTGGVQGSVTYESADSDLERPYAVNIVITYSTGGGASTTTITLPLFRHESKAFDLNAGTMSISGKCFATDAIITEA